MKPVLCQTNLVRRGSIYYFRKKISADLQQHYRIASNEIRVSLRTIDKAVAVRLALQKAVEQEQLFSQARDSLTKPSTPLSPELSKALAASLLNKCLEVDE